VVGISVFYAKNVTDHRRSRYAPKIIGDQFRSDAGKNIPGSEARRNIRGSDADFVGK